VLPPSQQRCTPFATWTSGSNGCYCKMTSGESGDRQSDNNRSTSGMCGPPPPPGPP
jgi:hypothetical protein